MPSIPTCYFGELEYDAEGLFEFPNGIPGFEEHERFLFIERPHAHPLVFMQSFRRANLCFIVAPVAIADPKFSIELTPEERACLQLPADENTAHAEDVVCLGLITAREGADPTINLASPIVLNVKSRKGVQAIRSEATHSLRQPLLAPGGDVRCS